MEPITPAIKDKILYYVRDKVELEAIVYVPTKKLIEETGTDFQTVRAVLRQFERLGLLEEANVGNENISIIVRADLHDLAHNGGFVFIEELLVTTVDKMNIELEKLRKDLQPDIIGKLNNVFSIAGNLTTIIAGIKK